MPDPTPVVPTPHRSPNSLYDALAAGYDASYAVPGHRKAYDVLAWERVRGLLPSSPGVVIDAGCGTGRWAEKFLGLGHQVVGIEQAPGMREVIASRELGSGFTLVAESMETARIAPASADLVVAMGSAQFTSDPAASIRRFAGWVRPGGHVCVYVDSRLALVLELLRLDRREEALLRLRTGRGIWAVDGVQADVHLYDHAELRRDFLAAGLDAVSGHGLLVSASTIGKAGCTRAMQEDEAAFLALERVLSDDPLMIDAGKHLFMSGRRPQATPGHA